MRDPAETPDREADSHVLNELVDQITGRLQAGKSIDLVEYVQRYPELEDRLRKLWPGILMLADLGHAKPETPSSKSPDLSDSLKSVHGTLGEFRLLREIGRGGMGVVFEAEQVSLQRRVALKVLPFASVLRPTQLQRFENEIQIAAALDHPNIVRVFSVGCERGVHHFAMQLIEGRSLAEVIGELRRIHTGEPADRDTSAVAADETPGEPRPQYHQDEEVSDGGVEPADTVPLAQAHISTVRSTSDVEFFRSVAQIGIQAAEALEHAHQKGVVHRDVKPSNLMLDAQGHLYVTDFGLARVQSETGLTMSGDLLGTLRYMSPEQAEGKRDVLDHRSDIYSLGVTLYELLTLRPAFSAEDRHRLLRKVTERAPELPRRLNEAIPKDLETIVLKAMAREPEARYLTAKELADDLRRYLEDEEIRAKPLSLSQRGKAWVRSRRWRVGIAITLSTIAVVILLSLALNWGDKSMFSNSLRRRLGLEPLEKRLLLASITGTVYEDLNADGNQDPGESGLADRTVVLEPVNVDPLLTIPNPDPDIMPGQDQGYDQFGWQVVPMGNNFLVSATRENGIDEQGDPILNVGAAYLFDGSSGALLETFTDPDPVIFDMFSVGIAAVGDNVAVGTWRDIPRPERPALTGAAYLFSIDLNPETPPHLEQIFYDPNPVARDNFGAFPVAYGQNVLIADREEAAGEGGIVWLFDSSDGTVIRTFDNPTPDAGDRFGRKITTIGDKVLVSDPLDDTAGPDAGAVYLFDGQGQLLRTFLNPSPDAGDEFGFALAPMGENVLIVANTDSTDAPEAGIAYLFDTTTGELLQTFHNPTPEDTDRFGRGPAAHGNHVLLSASSDNTGGDNAGSAYVFDASTGSLLQTFHNPSPEDGDGFGSWSTFLANGLVALSSPRDEVGGPDTGAVYVFDVGSTTSVTNSAGSYTSTDLQSGSYEVRQVLADGYGQTSPSGGAHTVLVEGSDVTGIDFGSAPQTTYSSTDVPKTLKDAKNASKPGVTRSTLTVPDSLTILDVNVTLSIDHINAEDLDVFLAGPDGTRVELFTDIPGLGFVNTVLDDEAGTSITAGSYPFTGSFQPEGSLSDFTGDASGTWTLEINDDTKGYTGVLLNWSIAITHPGPPTVNQQPVAADDSATTPPGTPVTVSVLANDSDPDGDSLIVVSFTQASAGTVVMNAANTLTYTPNGAFTSDSFTYAISDGNGGSDSATVTITEGSAPTEIIVPSADVPKTIADPHPRKGPKPVTSVVTPTDAATVDTVTADATIVHGEQDDLTVSLTHPVGGSVALSHLAGNQWQAADSTEFYGEALDRTWTLTIVDSDRNGIAGTLTAWSITVTPQAEGAGGSGESNTMVAGTLPSSWTSPSDISSDEMGSSNSPSNLQPDLEDSTFNVDETTFFASSTVAQSANAAAVDAAFDELELESIGDELVEELAAGLL